MYQPLIGGMNLRELYIGKGSRKVDLDRTARNVATMKKWK